MHAGPLNIPRLLQGVSRSFGLSIRLLPSALREPVGLAYLLARISDTLADTATEPVARRAALLDSLLHALETPQDHPQLEHALRDFARQVSNPSEKKLLEHGQACLEALEQQPAGDQAAIRQVLSAITQGQRWDLSALDGPAHGVQSSAELDHYTWLVAGSVGEFWTRICDLHLKHWHSQTRADLMQWGASYGKGLQRLNILRDAGQDLRSGRCYWPAEELEPLGLDRDRLCTAARSGDLTTLQLLQPLFDQWLRTTQEQLEDGLRYSLALRGRRLRLASVLPCLIGVRTLALLRRAGPQALTTHIKVPRRDVQGLLLRLLMGGASDLAIERCWRSALPASRPSPVSARIGA